MLRVPCAVAVAFLSTGCRAGEAHERVVPGDPARGFALLSERGCTSCHASPSVAPEPAPRLEAVGARLTPRAIEAALGAGARMPDCLAPLSRRARGEARAALTHYLASLGGPLALEPLSADALAVERGRQLYHSVGCVACHAPFEAAETLARPLWEFAEAFEPAPAPAATSARDPLAARDPLSLAGLGARTTLAALARTLADPLAVHPSGRMPSLGLSAGEASDLAAYLLYEDALDEGAVLASRPGLLLDYHEADFSDDTADFDALVPVRSEIAASFFEGLARREEDFGYRFRGLLEVSEAGTYRFATTSDDASMLYLDGALVVDNRGQHGMDERSGERHLEPGRHTFELTYFEHWGGEGLEVSWAGPGFAQQPLGFEALSHLAVAHPETPEEPFRLDEELVRRGRELYGELGCAACHDGGSARAAPLSELDPRAGCLAAKPKGRAPRHRFAAGEREALIAAVELGTPPARTAAERLHGELARLNCGACHARDELPGPDDVRRSYFQVERGLDLGDEGRLPPSLERVGAKLKPAWFRAVLEGSGRARPYMRTRMPQFGAANVAALPELFAEVDSALRDEREPAFSAEAVEAGKRLAGTKGLGCIQCHDFAGHPSIGIPAVDLAEVHERIYPGWFTELLMDPVALKMNTRMPSFWVDGASPLQDLYDGDPAAQVEALWTYLSLGSSMPLPHGLVPLEGEYEVEPLDEPVCVGVFMAGVSPRTIAVGLPERLHYAFDVQNSRLAMAWRGRFLDARGTWHARAGQLEKPAGEDVLEFPSGPSIAVLPQMDAAWPTTSDGCKARGRKYPEDGETAVKARPELRRPSFLYDLGEFHVIESPKPVIKAGGSALQRNVTVSRSFPFGVNDPPLPTGVVLRAAVGRSISRDGAAWIVEGERVLRIVAPPSSYVATTQDGQRELRVPLDFRGGSFLGDTGDGFGKRDVHVAELELEYSW